MFPSPGPNAALAPGHDYVETYEQFFSPIRNQVARVFEIGVLKGESLRLWEAYFPNADIFGIDILDTSEHESDRITTFVADQSDREQLGDFLEAHGGDFDIIIDDGGHTMEQQQVSFGFLFPAVRPGGYYVLEDVHTSFSARFGTVGDGANSTSNMIVRYIRTGKFDSPYLMPDEEQYLGRHVDHCLYAFAANLYRSQYLICKKRAR